LALKNSPELLVLNKFGKVEAEGMGTRDLIAQAVCMGIPVIVAFRRATSSAGENLQENFQLS
jgi:Protein of unknown function (DUF2478)